MRMHYVRPELENLFAKEKHCAQDAARSPRLIQRQVPHTRSLQHWLIAAPGRDNGHLHALASLLHCQVDSGIHNAITAIGYIVQDVKYSHLIPYAAA
jgi:hypothetical protein